MIRIALRRVALPVAVALMVSLSACESTSGNGVSAPAPPPIDDPAPKSPTNLGISEQAPPPVVDYAPPMAGAMKCNASKGQAAVGQTATQSVVDKVIADTGSRTARVIKPGQAVTMDYRDERVNINVDSKNVITSIKCG